MDLTTGPRPRQFLELLSHTGALLLLALKLSFELAALLTRLPLGLLQLTR